MIHLHQFEILIRGITIVQQVSHDKTQHPSTDLDSKIFWSKNFD